MNVVFLGGGRITSAMLAGLRLAKTRHRLIVHDRTAAKLRALKLRYAVLIERDLRNAVAAADLLVIAVRPASVPQLLGDIHEVKRPLLAVSLAAGVPLRGLIKMLGAPVRWARAMPSPVCRSGRGLTGLAFPRGLPKKDRKIVRDLFGLFGPIVEIPETRFDTFTVTYSCSHGYHALATLAKAAERTRLDRKTALLAAAHALADGITAWRDGKESLDALLEEAATPGGIAATCAAAMDAAGYQRAVRKGIAAGLKRARANARL
jgi:pyrroline-5-carboxylate reductase